MKTGFWDGVLISAIGAVVGATLMYTARDTSCEQRTVSASYYLSLPDAITAREAYRRVVSQSAQDDFCIAPTDDGRWAGYLCNPADEPNPPERFWIGSTREEAEGWRAEHPTLDLCLYAHPDGIATAHCRAKRN